jgi:hypothetical protein
MAAARRANVERFRDLLDAMRVKTETRLITVTHNPITMARMDRLFGVTMAERGVSRLVFMADQILCRLRNFFTGLDNSNVYGRFNVRFHGQEMRSKVPKRMKNRPRFVSLKRDDPLADQVAIPHAASQEAHNARNPRQDCSYKH